MIDFFSHNVKLAFLDDFLPVSQIRGIFSSSHSQLLLEELVVLSPQTNKL